MPSVALASAPLKIRRPPPSAKIPPTPRLAPLTGGRPLSNSSLKNSAPLRVTLSRSAVKR